MKFLSLKYWLPIFIGGAVLLSSFSSSDDNLFEISKNLKLFAAVMVQLNNEYVDEFDPEVLVEVGMQAMVNSLDPYSVYYSEEDLGGYLFQTTGKYGGIGALIRTMESEVIVIEPYEGFPAEKAGLKSGDKILTIDGIPVSGKNSEEVSNLLKGNPGTAVKLQIRDVDTGAEKPIVITREEVAIKSVPYSGAVADGVCYIRLDGFTDACHREVKRAIQDFRENNELKGVVLDLRGNPGGLLQEAIDVAGLFLQKGTSVVSTKGKALTSEKFFNTRLAPLDTEVPLAILISRGSASAAEIVAGVVQDHDRGIVLGEKSFGKGLVQSSSDLAYNTKMKYTTAKYYLPSGRSVQAIDYSGRYTDGAEKIPDSLRTVYRTNNNRLVYDAGGVDPDITIETPFISNIAASLLRRQHIFNFASQYKRKNPTITSMKDIQLTERDLNDFLTFLKEKDFGYTSYGEQMAGDMLEIVSSDGYESFLKEDIEKLSALVDSDKEQELLNNKEEVLQLLREEISSRYFYQLGRIEASLDDDSVLKKAKELLTDGAKYSQLLQSR